MTRGFCWVTLPSRACAVSPAAERRLWCVKCVWRLSTPEIPVVWSDTDRVTLSFSRRKETARMAYTNVSDALSSMALGTPTWRGPSAGRARPERERCGWQGPAAGPERRAEWVAGRGVCGLASPHAPPHTPGVWRCCCVWCTEWPAAGRQEQGSNTDQDHPGVVPTPLGRETGEEEGAPRCPRRTPPRRIPTQSHRW